MKRVAPIKASEPSSKHATELDDEIVGVKKGGSAVAAVGAAASPSARRPRCEAKRGRR